MIVREHGHQCLAYIDESGFEPGAHRTHGWAPRGRKVFGERSGKYPDGNQILIRGSEVRTALDTPLVSNHIGPAFDDSEMVVLGHVHEDHIAGLHRLPNAPVYAHVLDLPTVRSWDGMLAAYGDMDPSQAAAMRANFERKFHYTPRPDAIGYEDGALWDLGSNRITAFHLPGHTAGHCALLIEPEEVLFIGDIDLTGFGPYYGDACSNLADFRRSLDAVARIARGLERDGLAVVSGRVDVGDVFGKVPQACGLCKKSARRDIECF